MITKQTSGNWVASILVEYVFLTALYSSFKRKKTNDNLRESRPFLGPFNFGIEGSAGSLTRPTTNQERESR